MPDDSDEVLHCVFDIRKRKSEDGKRWDGVRIDCSIVSEHMNVRCSNQSSECSSQSRLYSSAVGG